MPFSLVEYMSDLHAAHHSFLHVSQRIPAPSSVAHRSHTGRLTSDSEAGIWMMPVRARAFSTNTKRTLFGSPHGVVPVLSAQRMCRSFANPPARRTVMISFKDAGTFGQGKIRVCPLRGSVSTRQPFAYLYEKK